MSRMWMVVLGAVLAAACGSNTGGVCKAPDGGPCIAATGGGTASTGGGSSTGGGTAATGGGTAATGGGSSTGAVVHAATDCPHVTLPSATTVTYTGDNTGLPNWVASVRLEWGNAPDDSLVFTAPSAGNYAFAFTDSTTTNGGMGVSIRDMNNMFWGTCPASASGTMIDGFYESTSSPAPLTQGQQVLIYVSTTTWATPTHEGAYTLTITKQ